MKLWHAIFLVFVVLLGTETLLDRKDDTSALEAAESQLAARAEPAGYSSFPAKAEAVPAQAASLRSWFSPDEDSDGDENGELADDSNYVTHADGFSDTGENHPAAGPAVLVPRLVPSKTKFSVAGKAIAAPQIRLIEQAS